MKKSVLITLLISLINAATSQTIITENFDTGNLSASSETQVNLSSGVWTFYQTAVSSGVTGNAVKLNSSSSTPGFIITPSFTTVSTISFYAKAGSSGKTLTVQKSVNGGTFQTIATPVLTSSYTQYTLMLDDTARDIRIKFMNTTGSGTSEYIDDVVITTLSPAHINVNTNNLPSFGVCAVSTVSNILSYQLSANYLDSDVQISVSEPFEIGIDSTNFTNSLLLTPSEGIINTTTIYVRFKPVEPIGTQYAVIYHTSSSALTKTVGVSGISIATEPLQPPTITIQNVTGNSATFQLTSGDGQGVMVVVKEEEHVTFIPEDGVIYNGVSQNYTLATVIGDGNRIVYKGVPGVITVTGLSPATKYYVTCYSYNEGTNNSTNYLNHEYINSEITTLSKPALLFTPSVIDFGNVVKGESSIRSYSIKGIFLTPSEGTIAVEAPDGYEVSLEENGEFTKIVEVSYTGAGITQLQIFVKFTPTELKTYEGEIIHTGGGVVRSVVNLQGKGVIQQAVQEQPIGFASLAGGVTGGAGGRTVIATNATELQSYLNSNEPLIVYVSGTIDISGMITLRSNKTILGMGSDARIRGGGFEMNRYNNVIIRNITFENSPDDCMKINQNSHHIWVDHCTFLDGPTFDPSSSHDGLFDITRQSDYITISYCLFYNHSKTMLIGHSDGATDDVGYLRTTIHHNWFKGTLQRHPRVRFGNVHVFNNYFENNSIYGVASTCSAKVVVEGNYFKNVKYPIHIGYDASPWGFVNEYNNIYDSCGTPITDGRTGYKGTAISNPHSWNPQNEYSYTIDNPADIQSIVMANAGAGKIILGVEESTNNIPTKNLELYQNYPNPFNPTTSIYYRLTDAGFVNLKVYDILGREVTTLINKYQRPGVYSVRWDATGLESGIYFGVLKFNSHRNIIKMVYVK